MAGKKERSDFRLNVARYQVEHLPPVDGEAPDADAAASEQESDAGQPTMEQTAQFVEIAIEQAMRRGDFDNLPGAGKPIAGLHRVNDPDWWIRQKIEREQITGLGPPALTLRTEDASLNDRLDAAPSEQAARELLADFNARIIEARRQLQGGPPVVTETRDVDDEIVRWNDRRMARSRERERERQREAAELAAMTWRERRKARRERDGARREPE